MKSDPCVQCLNWPAPNLGCFKCMPPGLHVEDFEQALITANETAFQMSGSQYPGCDCWALIQICPLGCPCDNVCGCDPCSIEKVNVHHFLNQPITQLIDVTVDGDTLTETSDWAILRNKYLVVPSHAQRCKWVAKVRYGRTPPARLVNLRDELFIAELSKCGNIQDCCTETVSDSAEIIRQIGLESQPSQQARFFDIGDQSLQYNVEVLAKGSVNMYNPDLINGVDVQQLVMDWIDRQNQTNSYAEPVIPTDEVLYNDLGQPIS